MATHTGSDTQIQSWLDRFCAGEHGARDELLRHFDRRMCALTRTMLRSSPRVCRWEETDDVYQRAVLRLYQSLAKVKAKPKSIRKLFRLARLQINRELIDLARHYYGAEGLGENHATDRPDSRLSGLHRHEPLDDTFNPSTIAGWSEFHEQAAALPESECEVFGLRWYSGLSCEQIGKVIEVSEKTARRRWRSACRRIHRNMRSSPDE